MKHPVFALMAMLLWIGQISAGEPVDFADPVLKAIIEEELWVENPTPEDLLGLTSLNANWRDIQDISGLEYAGNLQTLRLNSNNISDLAPLSALINLEYLNLHANYIRDVSALSRMSKLDTLILRDNYISDISALSGLSSLVNLDLLRNEVQDISALAKLHSLQEVDLGFNRISDVSPLTSLTSLTYLDLSGNPLDAEACATHIPQIIANNPGIQVAYEPCGPVRRIALSSSVGGSVVNPGEGEFLYENGQSVRLEAETDPGYTFAKWAGSISSTQNPMWISVLGDYSIRAEFVVTPGLDDETDLNGDQQLPARCVQVLYVDDDAPDDPGPTDVTRSDPLEDGTVGHPFDSIQEALDFSAPDEVCILVRPGTYRESIHVLDRSVTLLGIDPGEPQPRPYPVLEGAGTEPVIRLTGEEDHDCFVEGFAITRGLSGTGAAIYCDGGSPVISNCLVVGNRASDPDGATIYCRSSRPRLTNCTIVDNGNGFGGAAVHAVDCQVEVTDSILWRNAPANIRLDGTSAVTMQYCNLEGGWPGPGNFSRSPLFVQPGYWVAADDPNMVLGPENAEAVWMHGDYHLQSRMGRWDGVARVWLVDQSNSPCLDAADPNVPVVREPSPNGGRANVGAYGRTIQASKSDVEP